MRLKSRYHEPDWWLLAIVLTLVMFGSVMIFSSTTGLVSGTTLGANSFLIRQLIFATIGLIFMIIAIHTDYHYLRPLSLIAIFGVGALLMLLLMTSPDVNGARRWFDLGPIQVQPSELAKPAIIIYLASWLAGMGNRVKDFKHGLAQFVIVMSTLITLVMLEPDLGTSILLGMVGGAMFFVAGANIVHFFAVVLTGSASFLMLALQASYRRERLLAFLDPESNAKGTGWHLLQARLALGDGGLFGLGLGSSRQKFTWLPAPHNDAIFAVIGEELGLVGACFVLLLFGVLGYRGYQVARRAPDQFGMLIGVGITTWLIFQALINIGGVTSAIPFTGITLPFISYGGSSLIVTMTAVGILLNISRQTEDNPVPVADAYDYAASPAAAVMAAGRQGQLANPDFNPASLAGDREAPVYQPARYRRRSWS